MSSYDELATINVSNAFYAVRDSSIILFPTPNESITGGLVMRAITTLKDIEESTIESEIFAGHSELRQYVQLVAEGLCVDLFGRARQYDDKAQAQQEYDT